MRPRLTVSISGVLIGCLLTTQAVVASFTEGRSRREMEVARLRAHFDTVDVELRARDVSRLNPPQRASRARLVNWLRDYRDAGVFPTNTFVADRAVPIFRDDRGVLCPMSYLIDRSGRGDLVARIAETKNLAYIRELADDADLLQWLENAGLTVAEAARIQPSYPCGFGHDCPPVEIPGDPPVGRGYAALSIGVGGLSLLTLGRSLASPTQDHGLQAVFSGTFETLLGVAHLNVNGPKGRVAMADTVVGGLAVGFGVRAMLVAAGRVKHPTSGSGKALAALSKVGLLTGEHRRGLQVQFTF